jgi:hypothetical protein
VRRHTHVLAARRQHSESTQAEHRVSVRVCSTSGHALHAPRTRPSRASS